MRGRIHLLGVIVALPAVVLLFMHAVRGSGPGAAIFGASVVGLLGTSSLHHCPTWPPHIEATLQRLDHSMIYFLIAGSYTPFCLHVGELSARVRAQVTATV
jgi:hemolysin III